MIELRGQEPGPRSIILAGVHGNERAGIEAFQKVLPTGEEAFVLGEITSS